VRSVGYFSAKNWVNLRKMLPSNKNRLFQALIVSWLFFKTGLLRVRYKHKKSESVRFLLFLMEVPEEVIKHFYI
jgi:hypothetical protein